MPYTGFNPHLLHARDALHALCSTLPFPERAAGARKALQIIIDNPAVLDPEIIEIIHDALDPNLTANEQAKAMAGALETIFRLVEGHT
jgi:hypothetical protein